MTTLNRTYGTTLTDPTETLNRQSLLSGCYTLKLSENPSTSFASGFLASDVTMNNVFEAKPDVWTGPKVKSWSRGTLSSKLETKSVKAWLVGP